MTEFEKKLQANPDSFDFADIPTDRHLSDADRDATTPDHVKEAIAKRKAAQDGARPAG